MPDAIVVGSGPNGLAAAIMLARAGWSVRLREGDERIGGGLRSAALTLPGFLHDICSAIHPFAVASPLFRSLPLDQHGLEWVHPGAPLAHPLDAGTVVLEQSLEATVHKLGADGPAWRARLEALSGRFIELAPDLLAPLGWPGHPFALARFGLQALRSARALAQGTFREEKARALFAGLAAHSILPLDRPPTAAVGLMFGATAHAVGWPLPRGGSQALADALASYLRSLGVEIETGRPVTSFDELPPANARLLDITPRQFLRIAGAKLPARYRRTLERYRYGPGSFKVDWALADAIPWRDPACARAGTVHIGGTFDEIAASERAAWGRRPAEMPFVLLAQPSLFDATRAPPDKHTAWAYCHVPNGCDQDMTGRIEAQVERFAPGFRDCIIARSVRGPATLEQHNPNLVGGDIAGGAMDLRQLFFRPTVSLAPYRTPLPGVYLCSASTPPGGGVHGMCGYHAAMTAIRDARNRS